MKDLITACILQAQKKGKIGQIDLIVRYLRMKYRVNINPSALVKRILFMQMQKPYNSY